MGIFDRIRKIFSRSNSSTTSRDRNYSRGCIGQFDNVAWRSYLDEQNRHFNTSADNQRSSNVGEKPLATAHCQSNIASVKAQTSNTSQTQRDVNLHSEGASSCKGFTFLDYAKISNTATNEVAELPCSAEYQVKVKNISTFSGRNDNGQENERPRDFKPAGYSSTGDMERLERKELCPNILLKLEQSKQTDNQKPLLSSKDNIDGVKSLEFGQNLKHETSSALHSTVSENGGHTSTIEEHRSSVSKYLIAATSKVTTSKEIDTARNPVVSKRTARTASVPMTHPLPPHNETSAAVFSLKTSIPVILQQSATPNKNHYTTQTPNNAKIIERNNYHVTSHKIAKKPADHRGETATFASPQQSKSLCKTGASCITDGSFPYKTTQNIDTPKTQILSYSKASVLVTPPVASSSNAPTVPTAHTYIGVNDVVDPPIIRKSLPKTQAKLRSGFYHVVKGKYIFILQIFSSPSGQAEMKITDIDPYVHEF